MKSLAVVRAQIKYFEQSSGRLVLSIVGFDEQLSPVLINAGIVAAAVLVNGDVVVKID